MTRLSTAITAGVATACLAIALIVSGPSQRSSSPAAASPDARAAASPDAGPKVAGAPGKIRLLERPQTEADRLSERLSESLRGVGGTPELARRALSTRGRDFYVLPAADGLCIAMVSRPEGGQGYACHTERQWRDGSGGPGRILTRCSSKPGGGCASVTLFDVVPDGVHTVRILRHGRRPVSIPVTGNVYLAKLDARPRSPARPTHVVYHRPFRATVRQRIYLTG
jgi:hypothetical protein